MLKLIRADFYRLFHRVYVYVLLGSLAGLAVLVNIMIAHAGEYALTSFSWMFLLNWLALPMFLIPMITDVVFAEEYKEQTLKNTVSNGTNRIELYLSKTVSGVLLGLLLAVIAIGAYCASSLLFLSRDPQFTEQFVREFFQRMGAACVVYIAALTLANLSVALFRKNSLSVFAYYGAVFLSPYLFKLIRLPQVNDYLLANQVDLVAGGAAAQLQGAMTISAVTAAIGIACGLVCFYKREVG